MHKVTFGFKSVYEWSLLTSFPHIIVPPISRRRLALDPLLHDGLPCMRDNIPGANISLVLLSEYVFTPHSYLLCAYRVL